MPAIVLMERWHSQVAYVALWTVFGLALAVVWPSMYAIVGRRFRPSLQGRLFAIQLCHQRRVRLFLAAW